MPLFLHCPEPSRVIDSDRALSPSEVASFSGLSTSAEHLGCNKNTPKSLADGSSEKAVLDHQASAHSAAGDIRKNVEILLQVSTLFVCDVGPVAQLDAKVGVQRIVCTYHPDPTHCSRAPGLGGVHEAKELCSQATGIHPVAKLKSKENKLDSINTSEHFSKPTIARTSLIHSSFAALPYSTFSDLGTLTFNEKLLTHFLDELAYVRGAQILVVSEGASKGNADTIPSVASSSTTCNR